MKMLRFIFYVIIFYFVIKALNAFSRWLAASAHKSQSSQNNPKNYSGFLKYDNVEEAEFTEIKTDSQKEKSDKS